MNYDDEDITTIPFWLTIIVFIVSLFAFFLVDHDYSLLWLVLLLLITAFLNIILNYSMLYGIIKVFNFIESKLIRDYDNVLFKSTNNYYYGNFSFSIFVLMFSSFIVFGLAAPISLEKYAISSLVGIGVLIVLICIIYILELFIRYRVFIYEEEINFRIGALGLMNIYFKFSELDGYIFSGYKDYKRIRIIKNGKVVQSVDSNKIKNIDYLITNLPITLLKEERLSKTDKLFWDIIGNPNE